MNWEKPEVVSADPMAFYVVKDNGSEWRDFDLRIMRGVMVLHKLKPNYVRGRPEWVCKITPPSNETSGMRDA